MAFDNYSILNEEEYITQLSDYYKSLLHGRLMSIDVNDATDAEIQSFVIDFDTKKSYDNNSCTWLKIGDIRTSKYNGKSFSFINLLPSNGDPIRVNFSLFNYFMSPLPTGKQPTLEKFDKYKAIYRCTIDGKSISPEIFFSEHKGEKLLYLFSFDAVNAFNKIKRCYYFAFNLVSCSNLRLHILSCQIAMLKKCLLYPDLETPFPHVKMYMNNEGPNPLPFIDYFKCSYTYDFTKRIFDKEFRSKFTDKLYELEKLR